MKLKSFNYLLGLLILLLFLPVQGEDKIDIWKNDKSNNNSISTNKELKINKPNLENIKILSENQKIEIEEGSLINSKETKVYGTHDPNDYNFDLNMWSTTKAEDIRASLKRLSRANLSKTSNEILEMILLSFSYPPKDMDEKEFVNLKVNWLIQNNRTNLVESFLKQNEEFENKSKAVQYLVDENISKGNIKEGCDKIKFIDARIKDSYLEKFRIYCLVFNNKKSEAKLLLDLLREQKKSSKFYDDKINFLLGVTSKTTNKINENNLLNFYLSSVTIKDFKFEPNKNTKQQIWKYLNSTNLIKLEDVSDKEKLKDLELAANKGQISPSKIFEIYKKIPFDLSTLINANKNYQTLNASYARSLIYQKFLLSDGVESKIENLFLLEELFKKDNLSNIYSKFLSDKIKEIGVKNLPEKFQEAASSRLVTDEELLLGKIKYNDKILHQSKIIKYFNGGENNKKIQKDVDKIFKKISKNKKYFISAKDLALANSLLTDGFTLPSNFNYKILSSKYDAPKNLLSLIDNGQNAFLALKIVEIIGEDEPHQLDPETIYFITDLLNKMNLITIRNKILKSALPLRT
mgnify:CR=1 FL=1|jgi:hypothetical protein